MIVEHPINSGYQNSDQGHHDVSRVQPAVVGVGRHAFFYQLYSPGQRPVAESEQPVGQVECWIIQERGRLYRLCISYSVDVFLFIFLKSPSITHLILEDLGKLENDHEAANQNNLPQLSFFLWGFWLIQPSKMLGLRYWWQGTWCWCSFSLKLVGLLYQAFY